MSHKTLNDGLKEAGSAVALLWNTQAPEFKVPVVPPEYSGWKEEQVAWHEGAALFNLSHHMHNLFIEGPDARRLITDVCANNFDVFDIGQAKQAMAVTPLGHHIADGVLMRMAEDVYVGNLVAPLNTWLMYHAQTGNYDVSTRLVRPVDADNKPVEPPYFRYQVQGPKAMDVVQKLLGGPAPKVKFFHSEPVSIAGATVLAFRHGMAGQPGFEFIGDWENAEPVYQALLEAGADFGIAEVGGQAYFTAAVESGWIPLVIPGIYTDPDLTTYRDFVPLASLEGKRPLHGSFYSENIEDYYVSPFELDYGRFLNRRFDFIGGEALRQAENKPRRTKVTLVFNEEDVRAVLGDDLGYMRREAYDRIEHDGQLVGVALHTINKPIYGTILSLGLIEEAYAKPGTQVTIAWGEHPGPGAPADAHRDLPRIRATVEPCPYEHHARTSYRA